MLKVKKKNIVKTVQKIKSKWENKGNGREFILYVYVFNCGEILGKSVG